MTGPRKRDLVFLPGQFLVLLVPFLHFSGGFMPVGILVGARDYNWPAVPILLLGPAMLGTAMVASTFRQALARRLSHAERIGAYVLAFAFLAVLACACVNQLLGAVLGPTLLLAALGAIAVLASTVKGRLALQAHAHVALLTAWIMNMGFAVVVSLAESHRLGTGWWVGLVSVVAVAVEATLRVRRALRSEGEGGAEARQS